MPICPNSACPYKGEYQPESEFDGFKWCKTCRDKAQKRKKTSFGGSNSNAAKIAKTDKLEIGDPPLFVYDWDRQKHEEWLQNLIKGVER